MVESYDVERVWELFLSYDLNISESFKWSSIQLLKVSSQSVNVFFVNVWQALDMYEDAYLLWLDTFQPTSLVTSHWNTGLELLTCVDLGEKFKHFIEDMDALGVKKHPSTLDILYLFLFMLSFLSCFYSFFYCFFLTFANWITLLLLIGIDRLDHYRRLGMKEERRDFANSLIHACAKEGTCCLQHDWYSTTYESIIRSFYESHDFAAALSFYDTHQDYFQFSHWVFNMLLDAFLRTGKSIFIIYQNFAILSVRIIIYLLLVTSY